MVNIAQDSTATPDHWLAREFRKVWMDSAPLTATAVLMTVALAASLLGLLFDPRTIAGAAAWQKPVKFASSTAIFAATIAWLFRYITIWPTAIRAAGWILAAVLILEVAIIDLQAWRGTTSHFNARTALDAALFGIMAVAIGILLLASIFILVALFRQKFHCPAWGWWLRMGMLTTVLGSAAGGFMTRPTAEQMATIRAGKPIEAVGGHTVGGPDGGPGMAGVGWSTEHGDLRIAHFLGLHGIQIIPFIGWFLMRRGRRVEHRQRALAITVTASYLALFGILLWQALRGQSIVAPDGTTLAVGAVWLAATITSLIYFVAERGAQGSAPAGSLKALRLEE